jgi:methylated-DNA-[protein]-cysteine S-methyltransferase
MTARRVLATPIGPMTLFAAEHGISALHFGDKASASDDERSPLSAGVSDVLDLGDRQLTEFFAGTRTSFDLPLDRPGTPFQHAVWAALTDIPFGRTSTYGEVARAIGASGAARAVGIACGRNPIAIVIPCHRVIGASGRLTGYAGGLDHKRDLLQWEELHAKPVPDRLF